MKFCSKCVLPGSFPGIEFNEEGICNYCRNSQLPDQEKKEEYIKMFENLLDSVRGKHDFDVLLAYSGGKDSTYTMYELANKYKMNVLAFTFDNGFISEQARENIIRMSDLCGATSIIVRPPFPKLNQPQWLFEQAPNPSSPRRGLSVPQPQPFQPPPPLSAGGTTLPPTCSPPKTTRTGRVSIRDGRRAPRAALTTR